MRTQTNSLLGCAYARECSENQSIDWEKLDTNKGKLFTTVAPLVNNYMPENDKGQEKSPKKPHFFSKNRISAQKAVFYAKICRGGSRTALSSQINERYFRSFKKNAPSKALKPGNLLDFEWRKLYNTIIHS
jgi:hypothetical protein